VTVDGTFETCWLIVATIYILFTYGYFLLLVVHSSVSSSMVLIFVCSLVLKLWSGSRHWHAFPYVTILCNTDEIFLCFEFRIVFEFLYVDVSEKTKSKAEMIAVVMLFFVSLIAS